MSLIDSSEGMGLQELTLKEIQQIEFGILKHFDSFCKEHNISYFLSNGTLLGAIKYKGFIPWDDDIDVFVPREDYERLLCSYPSNKYFALIHQQNDTKYIFPFAKLYDRSTRIWNQSTPSITSPGVHIDIFPLDYWPDDIKLAKKQAKQVFVIAQKLCFSVTKMGLGRNWLRTVAKNAIIAYTHVVGSERYRKKLAKVLRGGLSQAGVMYRGCVVWPIYGINEILPAEVFSQSVKVTFEGNEFPAPVGYDEYLRNLYGDYRLDPPVESQKSHHSLRAYRE